MAQIVKDGITFDDVLLIPAYSQVVPTQVNLNTNLTKKIKLGSQRGTSEAVAIKKEQKAKKYPFELREYDSAPLAIEDLLNGRIDCAYMDELPADDSIAKGRAVKKIGTHGTPTDFGVAVRKSDTELLKIINEGYKKLMADPYWKELQKKHLPH